MQNLWLRLEQFFTQQHWPVSLNPGASEAEIVEVEQSLGQRFPDDLRASLQIHDGEDWQQGFRWLYDRMVLLPAARILTRWQEQQILYARYGEEFGDDDQDDGRIRNIAFHPKRIPITESDADVSLWLDFTPGPQGIAGQVITNITECDFIVLAPNFRTFLTRYAELLATGAFFYEAETYDAVIPQNLEALHNGVVRSDNFYRQLFPLDTPR